MEALQKSSSKSIEVQRKEYGTLLGLDEPVSEEVLLAALEDDSYAHNLLVSRRSPEFLRMLLDNPPSTRKLSKATTPKSNSELIKKGAKSLVDWAKTGFKTVDAQVLQTREDACLSCPHMQDPHSNLQRIIASNIVSDEVGRRTGDRTCELCGCTLAKKIRLTSEACPADHPEKKGYTRWNEKV